MRNMEILSRVPLVYSLRRISTSTTSFFKRAEIKVFAMRSSSMRYLKTESYMGFAMFTIIGCQLYLFLQK